MYTIQQITTDPLQTQSLVLPDGTSIQFTIVYKPLQYSWFIQDLVYGDFEIQGARICVSPNMLYQYKNQIPFGLACFSANNREPTLQDDFSSGNAQLYILTPEEVAEYASFLSG